MKYVIQKRGKYLKGHHSKGLDYYFMWTKDVSEARTFEPDDSNSDYFASKTGGKVIGIEL